MSDAFWTGLFVFLGLLLNAVVQYVNARKAAAKVHDVANALEINNAIADGKLSEIKQTGIDTHTLVNSNMGSQLKLTAVALRRVAELTENEDDFNAAVEAEKLLADHVRKQAVVDSGAKTIRKPDE